MTLDEQLLQMEEARQESRLQYINSHKYKLDNEMLEFKMWCHSKGWWFNLGEKDFKQYKKEMQKNFDFDIEKTIYEKWFGYEFTYDNINEKWRSKCDKHLVLNKKEG